MHAPTKLQLQQFLVCDEGNGFMDIYTELLIWKAGMWSMCAVQCRERRVGVRNYRLGGPHAPAQHSHRHIHTYAHTLTPQMRQLCHQTLSLARGNSGVGGERRMGERSGGGREGELMENGVVSQLIGDALPDLQCLLFPSWLPDATMNCTDTVRL